jgi:SAM-dependent methyltransferase
MLRASAERIAALLEPGDLVLDVGGWAKPFPRADWVLDLMPYETRGAYGEATGEPERFSAETWIERDICEREPWPFADDQFDFVICSHTLEDVRDPLWVCSELTRVARAGYVEVPSRLEEQSWGVAGEWVGWSHHHWLCDLDDAAITFVLKPHAIHGRGRYYFEAPIASVLTPEERVATMFWQGDFDFGERIFFVHDELDDYLAGFVARHREELAARVPRPSLGARIRRRLRASAGRT